MKKLVLITIVGMFAVTAFAQGPFGGFGGRQGFGFGGFGMGPMRGPAPQARIEKKEAPKPLVKEQKKEELKKPQLKKPQVKKPEAKKQIKKQPQRQARPQMQRRGGFGFGMQMPQRQPVPQFGGGFGMIPQRGFGFAPQQPRQPQFDRQGRFPQRRMQREPQRGMRGPQQRRGGRR